MRGVVVIAPPLEPRRVAQFQRQIFDRIEELASLIASDAFNAIVQGERKRLIRELAALELLDHVLLERMQAFGSGA